MRLYDSREHVHRGRPPVSGQRPCLRVAQAASIILLVLAGPFPSSARGGAADTYVVSHWNVEEGLPEHTVKAILQTQDGYLWLGTYNGLARFDGLRFTVFNSANTPALRSEDITTLFQDTSGRLWIGTEHGVACHDQRGFAECPGSQLFRDAHITRIVERADGTLFAATDQGVFHREGERFVEMTVPNSSWPTRSSFVGVDSSGALWVSHRSHLYAWENGRLDARGHFRSEISEILADRDGAFWCSLSDGTIARVAGGTVTQPDELRGIKPNHGFHQARNGDVWIATRDGAVREREGQILRISKADGLPGDIVKTALEDREGNIWLGLSDMGLVRLRAKRLDTYSTRNGLTSDDAIAVLEDQAGRVWLGTFEGGLNLFEGGQWRAPKFPGLPPDVHHVISLCQARDGGIWFGTYGQGAFRWNGREVERMIRTPEAVIRVIFEDRDGGVWFGSNKHGAEYHRGETTRQYNTENGLSLNYVTAIAQDASGDVWVGTEDGLNRISNGQVTRFYRKDGLGGNLINALFADGAGALWIGTSGGLSRRLNGQFSTVTTAHGLTFDVVNQIIEDNAGNLWMGSRLGIFRARKENVNAVMEGRSRDIFCVSYGKTDGLLNSSFVGGFQPTCMKTREGRLWFCSPGGATVIDPKRLIHDQPPPPVYIESILADGEELRRDGPNPRSSGNAARGKRWQAAAASADPTESSAPVRIQPGTRRLEIRYTALSLSSAKNVLFVCKLEGYDQDWQYVGPRRAAYYTRVPPGQYRFRVATATGEGGERAPEAALALIVLPQFHETAWYRMLLYGSAAIVLVGLYRLRIRHVREVEQLRWRIASDLHDEVGSNLSNIALLAHLGEFPQSAAASPRQEFAEISRVALETAHSVRDLVWFISPECDTLDELARQMESAAERSQPAKVDFASALDNGRRSLSLTFRRHVFFLYKEALHNALKHGRARQIQIRLTERRGELELWMKDDGVGFDAASVWRGHGLKTMRRRAQEIGGTLDIWSRPGRGTEIHLHAQLR